MLKRMKFAAHVSILAAGLMFAGAGCGSSAEDNNGTNNGAEPVDCSVADELTEEMVSGGMTIEADTCYRVNSRLRVTDGTLTLSPGVTLEFAEGASIEVIDQGRLNSVGTEDNPILLTGAEAIRGHWKGIRIDTVSADNVFDHVILEYAGGDGWQGGDNAEAGLWLTGKATVTNSTFRENANFALQARDTSDISGFAGNTFSNNDAPMWVYPDRVGEMAGTSEFVDNDENFVRVSFGNTNKVSVEQSWKDIGVPYRITDRTYIEAALTLEPGVVLSFDEHRSFIVRNEGSLAAVGTADAPITLTGAEQLRGYWKGIHIGTNASANAFDHVVLEYAGSEGWQGGDNAEAGLWLTGRAKITNSTFRENANFALQARRESVLGEFGDNTFSNNDAPMWAAPDRIGEMSGTSEFVDNDENFVRVTFGNTDKVSVEQSWKDIGVPYRITDRTYIEAALTLEAGVILEFAENRQFIVRNGGSLHAAGEEGNEVILRGADDAPEDEPVQGYWMGLHFSTNSPANVLEHTVVAEAGSDNWTGGDNNLAAIYMSDNAQLSLDTVTIRDSGGYGFLLRGDSNIVSCDAVTFENLLVGPVNNETGNPDAACAL